MKRIFPTILVLFVLVNFCISSPNSMHSCVYVSTDTNLVKVDLITDKTELISPLAIHTDISPRGLAVDANGNIYVTVSQNWSNRILKITPTSTKFPKVEYFTEPEVFQYGFGQIDFNSKGHLFAAGDTTQSIYEYDLQGKLVSKILLENGYDYTNNVGLYIDSDILYSVGYFSPRILSKYDTSGEAISGGILTAFTFPVEFYPASLCQSHTGNIAIGGGRLGTLLWDYNLTTNSISLIFDCADYGISTFIQYDPYENNYIIPSSTGLTLLNPDGTFIKTISNEYLQNTNAISKPFLSFESNCLNPLAFDIDNNCKIDLFDFTEFANEWLKCGYSDQNDCL